MYKYIYINVYIIIRDGQSLFLLALITDSCIFPEGKLKNNLKELKEQLEKEFNELGKKKDNNKQLIIDYYLGKLSKLNIKFSCDSIINKIVYIYIKIILSNRMLFQQNHSFQILKLMKLKIIKTV